MAAPPVWSAGASARAGAALTREGEAMSKRYYVDRDPPMLLCGWAVGMRSSSTAGGSPQS